MKTQNSKNNVLQLVIFLIFSIALAVPLLQFVFAPAPPQYFNVTVQINNIAPRIHNITINGAEPAFSATPTEDTYTNVSIVFNVTDENGQADIVSSTVSAALNFTSTVKRNYTACELLTTGLLDRLYNCTLLLDYFDENSSLYTLNVTAADTGGLRGENVTVNAFTYNVLTAIKLSINGSQQMLTFTANPGTKNVRPNSDQNVRNTGNDIFRKLNVTTYDLDGVNQVLGATNFTVNITNSTSGGILLGRIMGNGTMVNFTNQTVSDGPVLHRVNNSNATLYFSVNISSLLTQKSYNASTLWIVRVDRN